MDGPACLQRIHPEPERHRKKWDGARFRCVVTDAAGTQIVSREVALAVCGRVPTGDCYRLLPTLAVALIALALPRRRTMSRGQCRREISVTDV